MKNGDTIEEGGSYEEAARKLIDKQLALGGYRLADALSKMFKSEPPTVVKEKVTDLI